jgi:hypothetical protein
MAREVVHISEKQKQYIFRAGAGQEFASAARRANHLVQEHQEVAAVHRFLLPPPGVAMA